MFYKFFANRDRPSSDKNMGSKNASLYHDKQFNILQDSGALVGDCLEIGPGDGIFAYQCKDAGVCYEAVERSQAIQEQLTAEGFDVTHASVPPLPYHDRKFDTVCAFHVLEHMPTYEDALKFLLESRRVLKPGGKLVLEVPDFLRGGISFYAWDYTHSYVLTPLRLEQILLDTGFEVKRCVEFTGAFTSTLARWPIDLFGFVLHSRFVYWLACSIGLQPMLHKMYKTLAPAILVVSEVSGEECVDASLGCDSE